MNRQPQAFLRALHQLPHLHTTTTLQVSEGGGGTDIDPACSTGIPCSGLNVMDTRLTPGAYWGVNDAAALSESILHAVVRRCAPRDTS